ncbi:MAG: SRPBCC family protein [Acidobacteriota bacterium]
MKLTAKSLGIFKSARSVKVERTVTIEKTPEELYRFWSNLENLPRFMDHIESLEKIDDKRSHWVVKGPMGLRIEWNSELTDQIENKQLGWRSIEGSQVESSGLVQFTPAPGGRGTEVKVTLTYHPPGGILGAKFAKFFGEEPSIQVRESLCRLKQLLEVGEIATLASQSFGRAR